MKKIFVLLLVTSFALVCFGQNQSDLVAYYPFNGNANDESGNAHHGVVQGSTLTTDRFGNMNSAYSFQSKNDYITVNYDAIKLLNTSFTISAWVKIYSPQPRGHFIRRGNHANYILFVHGEQENRAIFTYSTDPAPLYTPNMVIGDKVIDLNEWNLITAVYDRDLGMTKLYVNGVLDGSNPNAQDPHNPGDNRPLEIGNWYGTRNGWNYAAFTGDLDDILIYKRALTDGEILGLYDITPPSLPDVTTASVSSVTSTSAAGGGNVTSDGGAAVTAGGVCWSTSENPTTADSHTTDGTGTGVYTSLITGLIPDTTYHVRAYATNSAGTSYGSDRTFTTLPIPPTVTTTAVSDITPATASSGGNVTSDGGTAVTVRGVCWSTSPNPTLADSHTTDGTGIGVFTSSITGLTHATTYHVRAYATNSAGMTYGSDKTFTTPPIPPTVTTTAVSGRTATTVSSGGNVTSDGGAAVTARGVCWSTSRNPTNACSHTTDGTGTGTFISTITGLTHAKSYHVRAYATNSAGTSYGSDIIFTTRPIPPTITTTAVSDITPTTASSGGNVTSDGGEAVTARGVCWSTSANPTISDSHTTDGTGTGTFTSSITGLIPGATYHVRAYATSSAGTTYGSDLAFAAITVLPTVTTTAVSDITPTTASSGGNVTSDGGAEVTAGGVCWGTSANPTTADSHTTDGTGTGTFASSITGLTPDTTYSVRAYAVNTEGTAYGNEVTFTTSKPPQIEVNRTRLNFGAVIGESQTGSQTLLIGNAGGGTLNWTAVPDETWIQVNPSSGTNSSLVTVSVDTGGLAAGTYTGTITTADASASNSPRSVSVFLNIYNPGTASVPFGEFSTPIDSSTTYGSMPVSGWVLDDIEVESVKIFREEGNGFYEIGEAKFVEGPRPDVELAYPTYPFNYRAVWCYMMLTIDLPNKGNGTFTITAVAADSSGNEVTLGAKTIICDNENAVKPFGAIDTPTLGGDASGRNFVNFGWVLTPPPNTIPTDGSTINVWVDGVPLTGNPLYNLYREDIAVDFSDYNNSDGAGGYYYLDTTLYANGIHTIAWSVTDDAGNTDGIGSRYFRVLNVENSSAVSAAAFGSPDTLSIHDLPVSGAPVYLKKGYDAGSEFTHYTQILYRLYPDNEGITTIDIKEDERIEVELRDQNEIVGNTNRWAGFLIIGDSQKPLPIGSTLDVSKGIFYWQPGPGFIGEYRFVFIEKGQNGEFEKRMIKVKIEPKF